MRKAAAEAARDPAVVAAKVGPRARLFSSLSILVPPRARAPFRAER